MEQFRNNNKINSNYLNALKKSSEANKINIIYLNINSIFNKEYEINAIVMLRCYDTVSLNESKLDESTKLTIFNNSFYNVHRRGKDKHGGGLLVFIKKEYNQIHIKSISRLGAFYLHFSINSHNLNFLFAYKPPSTNDLSFNFFFHS